MREFDPEALRTWTKCLGIETFVGSSGRVFPTDMKAAPLLRAWLRRLRAAGVPFHIRHRWLGWRLDGALAFETPAGPALSPPMPWCWRWAAGAGRSSAPTGRGCPGWRRAASTITPLLPANCGFDVDWSEHFRERFAGAPVKSVVLTASGHSHRGEFVITEAGIEGGPVYAHSAALRDAIAARARRPSPSISRRAATPRASPVISADRAAAGRSRRICAAPSGSRG